MPIKYVREEGGRTRDSRSYAPPTLFGAVARVGLKQRLIMIYIGVGAVVIGLAVMKASEHNDTFEGQRILRGVAAITAKQDGVLTLDANGIQAQYKPEPEILNRLNPGDHVTVLYQRSRLGHRIRVVEIGAVPLSP